MGLGCRTSSAVATMVTVYFIGYGFGSYALKLPPLIGRKKTCIGGFILALISVTVMLCVPNYYARTTCFFTLGLSNCKDMVTPWFIQSVGCDDRDKAIAYSIINSAIASPILVVYLYIILGGHDWFYLYLVVVILGYISLAILLVCPESPEHLLLQDKPKEAIKAFNTIADWNNGEHIDEDQRFQMNSGPSGGESDTNISSKFPSSKEKKITVSHPSYEEENEQEKEKKVSVRTRILHSISMKTERKSAFNWENT